jgi:hypothetical protein
MMSKGEPISPEMANTLFAWARLDPSQSGHSPNAAKVFQAFQERVQRLHGLNLGEVEFDFLHPID